MKRAARLSKAGGDGGGCRRRAIKCACGVRGDQASYQLVLATANLQFSLTQSLLQLVYDEAIARMDVDMSCMRVVS